MLFRRLAALLSALTILCPALSAQEKKQDSDSLFWLISARSASLLEEGGQNFRKVIGPARFFHNNTYLLCDTALWNVSSNIIYANGNVQIIQDRTVLSSATLEYVIDEDLAKFRGDLVQLEDKDKNTLRTRYLDYNTKDSVAVFQNGASMRDKDGQLIESRFGSYDSKEKSFTFMDNVNMFTDSIFIKTSRLEYKSDQNKAYFGYGTDAWEHENMLSANDGWYDRGQELFFFRKNVHIQTKNNEGWSDSLYFNRVTQDVEMLGDAEVMDTTRNVYALAGRLVYTDSLSRIRMTRDPAVMSVSDNNGVRDTLYFGADTLIYRSIPRCDVDSLSLAESAKRVANVGTDAVAEYRRRAAEEAAKKLEEAQKKKEEANRPPEKKKENAPQATASGEDSSGVEGEGIPPVAAPADTLRSPADTLPPPSDTLKVPSDTLKVPSDSLKAPSDTLKASSDPMILPADSLSAPLSASPDSLKASADSLAAKRPAPPADSTGIAFLWAVNNVKLYRSDIQMACDSLAYTDLDSLVRMYRNPLVFNENGTRQYAADSLYVTIENQAVKRANLLSNAFIATQEDTLYYNQIRGAEVVAYFDDKRNLERFDALGGATALFFLEENGTLATVNRVESKMLYATFRNANINQVYYFDNAKNDAYPIVQLPKDQSVLKGFEWTPEKRPKGREDVTSLNPRKSERLAYEARPKADFPFTEDYFPGYIKKIHDEIAKRDTLAARRQRERRQREEEMERLKRDSTLWIASADSLALSDSLARRDTVALDSLSVGKDSLAVVSDSLAKPVAAPADTLSAAPKEMTEAERKAYEKRRKQELKEAKKKARQEAREARWAKSDAKYEARQEAKRQKALQKERARKLKELRKREKKAAKEKKQLEKYIERYRRQQSRRDPLPPA